MDLKTATLQIINLMQMNSYTSIKKPFLGSKEVFVSIHIVRQREQGNMISHTIEDTIHCVRMFFTQKNKSKQTYMKYLFKIIF